MGLHCLPRPVCPKIHCNRTNFNPQQGYLEDAVKVDAVRSLEKQMAGVTETCMKLLEKLDSLRFEEDNKEARAKRKSLVDKIQVHVLPIYF